MNIVLRHSAAACLCVLLSVRPACAFWPVFDMGEIIQSVPQVKTGLETLANAKKQLSELKNGLSSIGINPQTIASFTPDLSKINDVIASADTVNINIENSVTGQDFALNSLDSVETLQKSATEDFINQIRNDISENKEYAETPSDKQPIVLASLMYEEIIEEEEEEEIPEEEALKNEIWEKFAVIKAENEQLNIKINDVMDGVLAILNRSAQQNQEILANLKKAITNTEKLSIEDKTAFKKRLAILMEKEQALSDQGVEIIEVKKNHYNQEYKNKIKDGLNNYEKAVVAYLKGNINKAEIDSIGQKLRENIRSINTKADSSVIQNYKEDATLVQKEIKNLKEDIEKLVLADNGEKMPN